MKATIIIAALAGSLFFISCGNAGDGTNSADSTNFNSNRESVSPGTMDSTTRMDTSMTTDSMRRP